MVSPAALKEFQSIILKDYGVSLTNAQATETAQDFLIALEVVLKPDSPAPELTTPPERRKNGN